MSEFCFASDFSLFITSVTLVPIYYVVTVEYYLLYISYLKDIKVTYLNNDVLILQFSARQNNQTSRQFVRCMHEVHKINS
jgi:hypothetical protein